MEEMKQKAKKELLRDLKKLMMDDTFGDMGDSLKSKKMQKVTVASPSEEGLEEGLSKAQQILQKRDEMMGYEESDEFDCGGKKDEYADGGVQLSDEEKARKFSDTLKGLSGASISEAERQRLADGDSDTLKGLSGTEVSEAERKRLREKMKYADGGLPEDEIPIMEEEEPQVFDGDLRLEELMESLPEELKMQLLEALSKRNDPEAALE